MLEVMKVIKPLSSEISILNDMGKWKDVAFLCAVAMCLEWHYFYMEPHIFKNKCSFNSYYPMIIC